MNLITDHCEMFRIFFPIRFATVTHAQSTDKSLANIFLYTFLHIMLLFVERYEYHINNNSFMPWKTYNEQSYFTAIVHGVSIERGRACDDNDDDDSCMAKRMK